MATSKSASSKPRKRATGNSSAPAKRRRSTAAKSSNGSSPAKKAAKPAKKAATKAKQPAEAVGSVVKDAGGTVANAAKRARGPALAAGATAAGLAGGIAVGAKLRGKRRHSLFAPRPSALGIPLARKSGAVKAAEALRDGAKHLSAATSQASGVARDVHEVKEALDKGGRGTSPLEVVVEGLTRRRGR